jgi:hypothetical protein
MNIVYCAVVGIKDNVILADTSKNYENYCDKVAHMLRSIISSKNILDSLEIENKQFINFVKHKNKLIILCISNETINSEKYKTFFVKFKDIIIREFHSIERVVPTNPEHLCLQDRLNSQLEKLMKDYENILYKDKSIIKGINNELEDIKDELNFAIKKVVTNEGDLTELLEKSNNINKEAFIMKNNAEKVEYQTRCMKPWMWVVLVFFLIGLIAFVCYCVTKCGSLYKPIC